MYMNECGMTISVGLPCLPASLPLFLHAACRFCSLVFENGVNETREVRDEIALFKENY